MFAIRCESDETVVSDGRHEATGGLADTAERTLDLVGHGASRAL
jgi:hypothetical protein